jgi:alginate O-acetyltransferase complex protein AlgI
MIFNEFQFIFGFMPVILAGCYWIVPRQYRRELLIAASLFFYSLSGLEHLAILVLGMIWVYAWTASDKIKGNSLRLWAAVLGPVTALFYYKYASFTLGSVQLLAGVDSTGSFSLFEDVLLPAGISFFTFQMIAFAIDRYRGQLQPTPQFRTFALYICFFPQLVAGPILRYSQVADAITNLASFRINREDLKTATGYFVLGLAAKVILADGLAGAMASFSSRPEDLSSDGALYVILGYSFQIYFDFYGYSLIAIGLGRLFGFHFPDNFLRPYEASNPREFWRRWHVSLSYWIRDYLYLPLGGNRLYLRNIVIVFAVCGLWHGAGWNFVVWGMFHALLVTGYTYFAASWDKMPIMLQRLLNFTLVSFGWLMFQYDFAGAFDLIGSLAGLAHTSASGPEFWDWSVLMLAAAVCFGVNLEKTISNAAISKRGSVFYSVGLGVIFTTSLLLLDSSQTFIYFRF